MAYVVKRGSKWSAVLTGRGMKKWEVLPADIKGKRAAQKEANRRQAQRENGPPRLKRGETTSWHELALVTIGRKRATSDEYSRKNWIPCLDHYVDRFKQVVGDRPISQITPADCRAYVAHRLSKPKPANHSTLRKEIRFLSSVFRDAVDDELIPKNPWNRIKLPPEPKPQSRVLSPKQATKLMAVAPADRALRYLIILSTSASKSEVLALKWADVNFRKRTIALRGRKKGQRRWGVESRTLPMPDILIAALRPQRGKPDVRVSPSRHNWNRDIEADCTAAKIDPAINYIGLRRTVLTWLAAANLNHAHIQATGGHKDGRTTDVYIKLAEVVLSEVSDTLGAILGG